MRLVMLASLLFTACTDDVVGSRHTNLALPRPPGALGSPEELPPDPPSCLPAGDDAWFALGSAGDDEIRGVVVTATGAIVVAGHDHVSGTSRAIVLERRPGPLADADNASAPRFEYRTILDTPGDDAFAALTYYNDRIWVAGHSNERIDGVTSYGGVDVVVGDLVPAGFRALARGFSSTDELPLQLAVGGGMLALGGYEQRVVGDTITWTNPLLAAYHVEPAWIAPSWLVTRPSAVTQRHTAVDVSTTRVFVSGTIADGDAPGAFAAAYDHDAGVVWHQLLSSDGSDRIVAIRDQGDGTLLWVGSATSSRGDADIAIGTLDAATGAPISRVLYGSTSHDERVAAATIDSLGRIYVTGDVDGSGFRVDGGIRQVDRDAFFVVFDYQGGVILDEQWSSEGDDVPTSIAADACGTAVLAGYTTGALAGAPQGGRDAFVLVTNVTR